MVINIKHLRPFLLIGAFIAVALFLENKPAPTSAQVTRPNIVVILTDDQDVASLPVMRKLMSFPEGSWINFTNAFANLSVCCPARATLLTGQYAHTTGVTRNNNGNNLNDANTLAVWLDQAGYRTGLVGKYLNGYPWKKGRRYVPPGWDSFQVIKGRGEAVDKPGSADKRTDQAISFINSSSASPFFLYLAYTGPHVPAQTPARYATADVYIPPNPPNFNEADVSDKPAWIRERPLLSQTTIDSWYEERIAAQRELLAIDDGVQRIIDALKANGQLDHTLIIFLADHGFSWGSHRLLQKHCGYEACIRFPLLIRYPGLAESREETRLVANVDLASTIADYAGVTPGLPQDGRTLIPLLTDSAPNWTEAVLLEKHLGKTGYYGIRVPSWKYIEYRNGDKELYDLTADPYELQNLANQPAYQTIQNDLAQQLRALHGF